VVAAGAGAAGVGGGEEVSGYPLEDACAALKEAGLPAYLYHSGGGVWLVRLDAGAGDDPPHVLISERCEWDGGPGFMVGVYKGWGDLGRWPGVGEDETRFADDLAGLPALVREGLRVVHSNGEQ